MEIIYLLFGIISVLLIIDGHALKKQERIRPLLKQISLGENKQKTDHIGQYMQVGGVIALIWTVAGYFLYDLLILPVFIVIYLLIVFVVAGIAIVSWRKKFH